MQIEDISKGILELESVDADDFSVKQLEKTKIRLEYLNLKGGLDPKIELDCLECDRSYDALLYNIPDFFIPATTAESIGL